jgi:hypothetical protein
MPCIYLYWSERDITVFGLTLDPGGDNLPGDLAPWTRNHYDWPINLDAAMEQAIGRVGRILREDGFYLARISKPALVFHAG